jgi:VWFA-related protein
MKYPVASFFLPLFLIPIALGQTKSQSRSRGAPQSGTQVHRRASQNKPQNRLIRICQGIAIPSGYTIVAYESSLVCPHGAYVLKKDGTDSRFSQTYRAPEPQPKNATVSTASRPRRINKPQMPELAGGANSLSTDYQPTLSAIPSGVPVSKPATDLSTTKLNDQPEEVGEGDVVRIDTNLVTVPVSVSDRDGRFVPGLRSEDFRVFENGIEQRIAYFEPTEKAFTVALMLDTSASTRFHLWEIKQAAIAFAKQLRPQDRVLVVTFNNKVLLLTEATNDLDVVTAVIEQNANTGASTRLYDAVSLVINKRLNNIPGRKAIVLFTDGVDTASYEASYESTLRAAEELDALIYPIQYDTSDYVSAMQGAGNITIVTTTTRNWPFPGRSSSRVIYGNPSVRTQVPGTVKDDYAKADHYLHELAYKTGARLYQANDPAQLADAFSRIAEELRRQYGLGYYPQTAVQSGERREIKVSVNRPDVAVRARRSYVQRALPAR